MKFKIEVINRQKKMRISLKRLKNTGKKTLEILMKYGDKKLLNLLKKKHVLLLSISIVLMGNKKIKELNFKYRNKKTTTDVLAFAYSDFYEKNELFLGEIFINPYLVKFRAINYGLPFWQELTRVLVHGILHLLDYDHERVSEARKMRKMEKYILNRLQT